MTAKELIRKNLNVPNVLTMIRLLLVPVYVVLFVSGQKYAALVTFLAASLTDLLELKKEFPDMQMVLHSDQGSVYASKDFNELLPMYNVIRSMSRAGTPTDNAAMEAINGWIKAELFMDFHVTGNTDISAHLSADSNGISIIPKAMNSGYR